MPTSPHRRSADGLSPAEWTILTGLLRYHAMTARQVTKWRWSPASFTWIKDLLLGLFERGYLERAQLASRLPRTPPLVYVLTGKALSYLRGEDHEVPERARPYRVRTLGYQHIAHLLAVNEFLIAGELLARRHPVLKLTTVIHDEDLKGRFHDARGSAIPDGFLDFEDHRHRVRRPLCPEIDNGTENQATVRAKVRALLEFAAGPYERVLGRKAVLFPIVAVPGEDRLAKLRTWVEAELRERSASDYARLFSLAALPLGWQVPEDARPSPEDIFVSPCWYRPFATEPESLFPGI